MAVNLGIHDALALGPALSAGLGLPVTLGNDVDMAAVGVHRHVGEPDASLAYFSIGTGFAAGLVLNGRLHRGVGGAGEIGHLPVPGGTARCSCGQIGCAETLASGGAMLRSWGRPDADIESLWDAAAAGDEQAAAIRAGAVGTVAWVIQCTVLLLDVERIVIGGGVTRLGDRLLDPLMDCLRDREAMSPLLPTYAMTERVTLADQNVEYGVIGAASIARSTVEPTS
jgi:predicted NBD/HSP70 family sugar kinase